MKPMLATVARSKACPFMGGQCCTSGCMAWVETDAGSTQVILPWPESIPRPKLRVDPFMVGDMRGQAIQLREDCDIALQPLVGTTHEGDRILSARPKDHRLLEIQVTVLRERAEQGYCSHFHKP
jgi:hypothetical protein